MLTSRIAMSKNTIGKKYRKALLSLLTAFFCSAIGITAMAASEEGGNKTDFIFHHVQDSHEWHFATIGHTHVTVPLPVIVYVKGSGLKFFMSSDFVDEHHVGIEKEGFYFDEHGHLAATDPSLDFYDISITKNVASLFISVVILFGVFLTVAKRYKQDPLTSPRGIQSVFEPIIMFVRDEIARPNIGEKKYERFMPYLLTVFFFIWFNNLLGLMPGAANLTGNIAVTMTLALFTFVITTISGSKDYWRHIFNTPGVPWWLKFPIPIMPVIEFVGVLTKPFSLMVRLFANITAGHIIVLSLIALVFIFESVYIGPVSVLFGLFMNFLELLVAFIQAFVFTLLSAIYFGLAVEEHEHHVEEHQKKLEKAPA
jgi:F-type H+-transporting ATPase subunit a